MWQVFIKNHSGNENNMSLCSLIQPTTILSVCISKSKESQYFSPHSLLPPSRPSPFLSWIIGLLIGLPTSILALSPPVCQTNIAGESDPTVHLSRMLQSLPFSFGVAVKFLTIASKTPHHLLLWFSECLSYWSFLVSAQLRRPSCSFANAPWMPVSGSLLILCPLPVHILSQCWMVHSHLFQVFTQQFPSQSTLLSRMP